MNKPLRRAVAAFLVVLAGCTRSETLTLSGASTLVPPMQAAADAFTTVAPDLRVFVQAGGTTRGVKETVYGLNDLGMAARELTPAEAAQVHAIPVAHDGVALIAHASNPTVGLSRTELREFYRDDRDTWAVDGRPVLCIQKSEGHATLVTFLEYAELSRSECRPDAVAGNNPAVIRAVAHSRGGLGYVSFGEAKTAIAAGMPIRILTVDGHTPSLESIAAGTYPMVRPLYLLSVGAPTGRAAQFVEFLLETPSGIEILREAGFVPARR